MFEGLGIRTDPRDGRWRFRGWAVFGHVLPRLVVAPFPCYADGTTARTLNVPGDEGETCPCERLAIIAQWLGVGYAFTFSFWRPYSRRLWG